MSVDTHNFVTKPCGGLPAKHTCFVRPQYSMCLAVAGCWDFLFGSSFPMRMHVSPCKSLLEGGRAVGALTLRGTVNELGRAFGGGDGDGDVQAVLAAM